MKPLTIECPHFSWIINCLQLLCMTKRWQCTNRLTKKVYILFKQNVFFLFILLSKPKTHCLFVVEPKPRDSDIEFIHEKKYIVFDQLDPNKRIGGTFFIYVGKNLKAGKNYQNRIKNVARLLSRDLRYAERPQKYLRCRVSWNRLDLQLFRSDATSL